MREVEVAAREKLLQARSEFQKVSRKSRSELEAQERRLTQKQDSIDKKAGRARPARQGAQPARPLPAAARSAEKREAELDR